VDVVKKFDIATIADLGVDISLYDKNMEIVFGQSERLVSGATLEMGGSCSIFAVQCAKLGLKTTVMGVMGNDIFGDFILEKLNKYKIDTNCIRKNAHVNTGIGVALCNDNDRAILTNLGATGLIKKEDVPMQNIRQSACLHIGSYFLNKGVRPHLKDIAKSARENGVVVSLDPNWDVDGRWDLMDDELADYVDIFLPNETELRRIFGEDDLDRALEMAANRFKVVALKMGQKGAIVKSGNLCFKADSLDVPYKESIGAGDSFDGGFMFGYLRGALLDTCLKMGVICGSLNTTCFGGTEGQPDLETLNKYLPINGGNQS
jgi:sugar/nucleoside kinase (ribokinase family)